jgi:ketosteroid isomerase-like protein
MSGAGEAEIRTLIANYGAAFDDADSDAVTALFAWPVTIWQFGDGHVFQDAGDLAQNVEALIDVFDEAGIAISNPEVTEVRIDGAAAFATAIWTQLDGAGFLLNRFTCHYLLIGGDGGWRIATVVNEAVREPASSAESVE